jgi:hypothetical protein
MSNNMHLMSRMVGIQKSLLLQHRSRQGVPWSTSDSESEIFVHEFLEKVFPSPYRFTSGTITDAAGRVSGLVDIAVEYPFLPSFPMLGSAERLMLAESVAAALTVRSDLRAQWSEVEESVREIRRLRRFWQSPAPIPGEGEAASVPCVAVGYEGFATIEELSQRLQATPPEARPDAALVVSSGCFIGYGIQATGLLGLYALCVTLNKLMEAVASAEVDLFAYVVNQAQPA